MPTYKDRHKDPHKFLHQWQVDDIFKEIVIARRQAVNANDAAEKVKDPAYSEAEQAQAKALVSIAVSLATLNELIVRGYTHP